MQFFADNIAIVSLIALVIAIVITIWKDTNLGTMALGIAFIVGALGGTPVKELVSGFPTSLFLLLVGITYFFGIAQTNGTLEKVTRYAVKSVRGNIAILPIVLFFLAAAISSIGAGQISTSALFATPVMALAVEVGISPLMMAIVVGCGAMGGVMSPLTPNGAIGTKIFAEIGVVQDMSVSVWFHVLVAHFFAAMFAYFLFGGMNLWKRQRAGGKDFDALKNIQVEPFSSKQKITLASITLLILLVIFAKVDLGFLAFVMGSLMILFGIGDERTVLKNMPWGAIILVTGVTVLVNLMKDVGGMDLFASIMAGMSTPFTVLLVVGFIAAIVSAYASTSGVIMPAFLPMAPLLIEKIGAPPETLVPLLFTIVVAGHLTDMSPLSTTGAVFIAGAPNSVERKPLYKGMLLWGLGMSVFGAVLCWMLYGILHLV